MRRCFKKKGNEDGVDKQQTHQTKADDAPIAAPDTTDTEQNLSAAETIDATHQPHQNANYLQFKRYLKKNQNSTYANRYGRRRPAGLKFKDASDDAHEGAQTSLAVVDTVSSSSYRKFKTRLLEPTTGAADRREEKFSFLQAPSARNEGYTLSDYGGHQGQYNKHSVYSVPNATKKPLLPMWASSLTSPALGKRRLRPHNWISQDSKGIVEEDRVHAFLDWLLEEQPALPPTAEVAAVQQEAHDALADAVEQHLYVHLRNANKRGLYAKRHFKKGETIVTIPLCVRQPQQEGEKSVAAVREDVPLLHYINSEQLKEHSVAAAERDIPPFETIKNLLLHTIHGKDSDTIFSKTPHLLFIDLFYCSLALACERAAGDASPYAGYLNLFRTAADPTLDTPLRPGAYLDDDEVVAVHDGVLDPPSLLEYKDHKSRYEHYMREVLKVWWNRHEAARLQLQEEEEGEHANPADAIVSAGEAGVTDSAEEVARRRKEEEERATYLAKDRDLARFYPPHVTPSTVAPPLPLDHPRTDALRPVGAEKEHHREAPHTTAVTSTTQGEETVEKSSGATDKKKTLLPPPTFDDLLWSFRFMLDRQKQLHALRMDKAKAFTADSPSSSASTGKDEQEEQVDFFARQVMRLKNGFYDKVLGVIRPPRPVGEKGASAPKIDYNFKNAYDAGTISTVVPLLDFFSHPTSGTANCTFHIKKTPLSHTEEKKDSEEDASLQAEYIAVEVQAAEDIDELDELTLLFSRTYSLSYNLYRNGYLCLRNREDDVIEALEENQLNTDFQYDRHANNAERETSVVQQ